MVHIGPGYPIELAMSPGLCRLRPQLTLKRSPQRNDPIAGLTYLLTLGVQVLTLMELPLRRPLQTEKSKRFGLHRKKCTDRPTAERVLKACFKRVTDDYQG